MWLKEGVVEWSKEKARVHFGKPLSWDVLEGEGTASKGWWNDKSGADEGMVRATTGRRGRNAMRGMTTRHEEITQVTAGSPAHGPTASCGTRSKLFSPPPPPPPYSP